MLSFLMSSLRGVNEISRLCFIQFISGVEASAASRRQCCVHPYASSYVYLSGNSGYRAVGEPCSLQQHDSCSVAHETERV